MRALGWENTSQMCRDIGMSPTVAGKLINMTQSPVNRTTGRWGDTALKIATALRCMPEDLWPEHMQQIVARSASAEVEVTFSQLAALGSTAPDSAELFERKQFVAVLIASLNVQEQCVIKTRMMGGSLREIGNVLREIGVSDVCYQRVRQIEDKAHRKMRDVARKRFGVDAKNLDRDCLAF